MESHKLAVNLFFLPYPVNSCVIRIDGILFLKYSLIEIGFQFRKIMQTQLKQQFAPIANDEKRIDVAIENGRAVIKMATWTDGLGWNTQKTITLEADLVEDLHRALASARVRLRATDCGEVVGGSARVLSFPSSS